MILKAIIATLKLSVLAVLVLMLGQVRFDGRRVSDHFASAVESPVVQAPVHWISTHFNFVEGQVLKRGAHSAVNKVKNSVTTERTKADDQQGLSGLLKNP